MSKTHYSAAELAAMKLPGLPTTERNARSMAERECWAYQEVAARGRTGKRREYALTSLPPEARQAILEHHGISQSGNSGKPLPLPAQAEIMPRNLLNDEQRKKEDARKGVLLALSRLRGETGCSQEAAMHTLLNLARTGRAEPAIIRTLQAARDRRGGKGDEFPSIRTLKRWLSAPDLAPRVVQKDMNVPPWAPILMTLYGQPQKPSLAWCLEELPKRLERGITAPSYSAARRFLEKVGNVERQRGRMLSREIKTLLPFVRRDTTHLMPGDIYTADGHTHDAEVAHPDHGKAFRPELTGVLDVGTRKCVGWSAGLAESTWAVMDAQRNAFETHGICAAWYVDNGSGYVNATQSDAVVGFANRVGFEIHHSLPYNSQARGIMERSHQSIWVRGAKTLPTYMGADMDREAKQKVFKLTRAHIKQTGNSPLLMDWDDFLAWCQQQVDAYNARPHRGLRKIRDAETGKLRHMSPNEAWQQAIDDGWAPSLLTDAERDDLFRPQKICTVSRGEIRFRNNLYFSRELTEFHGEKVRVAYDIHDPNQVWVRDMEGRLICVAEWDGNKRAYFPQSVIDQDREKRAKSREKRLELHLQEVRDELNPPLQIEHMPAQTLPTMAVLQYEIPVFTPSVNNEDSNMVRLPEPEPVRPMFETDAAKYRWLNNNPDLMRREDEGWMAWYRTTSEWLDLFGYFEVAAR